MEERALTQSFLSNEWRFILSIVAPVVAVVLAWGSFQTSQAVLTERLNKIETNELLHVQASLNRIEEQHLKLMVDVEKIKVILER